jgi:hypothetical protein
MLNRVAAALNQRGKEAIVYRGFYGSRFKIRRQIGIGSRKLG